MVEPNAFDANDVCLVDLESLVCRGHVLVAKVLQVSNEIPPCFWHDYTVQERTVASLKGQEKKGILSNMWNKMVPNKTNVKILRKQAPSYSKQDSCPSGSKPQEDSPSKGHLRRTKRTNTDAACDITPSTERYKSILVDFAYLADPERYDSHLHILQGEESDEERRKLIIQQENLERKFITELGKSLAKFHDLFCEILAFYYEINQFGTQLQKNHYVQYSMESLLQHRKGRQFLCELLYLYGNILILLDLYFPGTIRERLIIANHRYRSNINTSNKEATSVTVNNFEQLCKLFQRTGDSAASQKNGSPLIPEHDYFSRMPLSSSITMPIIECLIEHNIYPVKDLAFPSFHHRSTKLSNQASIIFIALYFQPNVFEQEEKMRQIVDRFFTDNWMVPLYNGELVDLFIEWKERYPLAKHVLDCTLTDDQIRVLTMQNTRQIKLWTNELNLCLNQTTINDLYVIDHTEKLNKCIRNSNVALRWRILHQSSKLLLQASSSSSSSTNVGNREVVNLFLLVSELEANVKEAYKKIIANKEEIWFKLKTNAVGRMQQLSNHFNGIDDLVDQKNEEVGAWFGKMSGEINNLRFEESSQDVQFCIDSLQDIKVLDLIDRSAQVKAIVTETESDLLRLVKCERVSIESCCIIENASECAYARMAMEYYVPIFHSGVTADPKSVGMLRSSFIKMASFLEKLPQPTQHNTDIDVTFAIQYHSNAMLTFVKEILDIIPRSIFSTYAMIVDSNEQSLSRLPTKIDADALATYTLFDNRYKLSKLTYELTVLTEGIIDMEETMFGTLKMNPQQLLEEGLRKELIRQISTAFHNNLQFPPQSDRSIKSLANNQKVFVESLKALSRRMEGFQRTIIWLQDFLRIDGLSIYIQESTRVIWHNVHLELGRSPSKNTENAPIIPSFPRSPNDPKSASFIGRTLTALLNFIDSKVTTYSRLLDGWFFHKNGELVLEAKTVNLLRKSIGVQGIIGVEALTCHKLTNEIESLYKFYGNAIGTYGVMLEQFRDGIFPEWQSPKHGLPFYSAAVTKVSKLMVPLLNFFFRIGQFQLLRRMLKLELMLGSSIDATELLQTVTVANKEIINILQSKPEICAIDEELVHVIKQVSCIHQAAGCGDPLTTILTKTDALENLPVLITLFVVNYMTRVSYDHRFQALRGGEGESFDGWPVITGIGTLLKQFNPTYTRATFSLLGQFVTCATKAHLIKAENDDPLISTGQCTEARNTLIFMTQLRSICDLDYSVIQDNVPQYMIEMLELID